MSPKQTKTNSRSTKPISEKDHIIPSLDLEEKPRMQGMQPPQGWLRWLGYLIACWPFFGLLLAIIYCPQPKAETKRYGKNVLILGLISFAVAFFYFLIKLFLLVIQGADKGLSGGYY